MPVLITKGYFRDELSVTSRCIRLSHMSRCGRGWCGLSSIHRTATGSRPTPSRPTISASTPRRTCPIPVPSTTGIALTSALEVRMPPWWPAPSGGPRRAVARAERWPAPSGGPRRAPRHHHGRHLPPAPGSHSAGEIAAFRTSRTGTGGRPMRRASVGSTWAKSPCRLAAKRPTSMSAAGAGTPCATMPAR